MNIQEAKAAAYDLIAGIEQAQIRIRQLNEFIAKESQKKPVGHDLKPKKPDITTDVTTKKTSPKIEIEKL